MQSGSSPGTNLGGKAVQKERCGDSLSTKEKHLLSPANPDGSEHFSKGKKIFSRVNKLFKSPRKHHRKLSESRSEEGASSDTEELERSSEIPLGSQARPGLPPRHFSPEPHRRRMAAHLPAGQTGEESLPTVESEPLFVVTAAAKASPATTAAAAAAPGSLLGTPQHLRSGETASDSGAAPPWDEALVDVEGTTELLAALRDKITALNQEIQAEMGVGATTLKDFLATLDNCDVTEKSRQNARKTFERGNRSRSKRLLQLQTKLEQLMAVTVEVQRAGVPRGREPEEFVKALMRSQPGAGSGKRKGVLDTVKQVGHRLEGAVDNMKGAAGSLGRSFMKPGRSNSLDNLLPHPIKDTHSEDGDLSNFAGGASSTLPRVSTIPRIVSTSGGGGPQSHSDPSEQQTGAGTSGVGANLSVVGSRPSGGNGGNGGGPGTARTASSSAGGQPGNGVGATGTGGADTASWRDRRSASECSQSNSSLREDVSTLRSVVDELRQQMENNNYAVEVNRRDLGRNADFYRMGLEETNSKMERLEELFNESINALKEDIHGLGEQLEYRFIDRHRNLRDNVESLRNQQSQIERRYEQQFRSLGGLDTGDAYAPSLLKTRLLDLLIAVFNLLVFLLSAAFQLGLRLANLSSHLRRRPAAVLLPLLLLGLVLGALLARDSVPWALVRRALRWAAARLAPDEPAPDDAS